MSTSGDIGRGQDALAPVTEYIRAQLEASMGLFLDRAQKTLNDTWPAIGEYRKQDQARYSASWLQTNKPRILSALHMRLIGALNAPPEEQNLPEEFGELRLMDADTLSAQLIRSRMVARVMERGRNDVTALEMRLEQLQRQGVPLNARALTPGALADGLLNALKDLQVPAEVQALLLDIYGDKGVQLLVEFYQGVNSVLIERGVLPNLQITPRIGGMPMRRAAASGTDAAASANASGDSAPVDERARLVQQLLDQVSQGEWQPALFQQLLNWQFAQAPAAGPMPMGAATMPGPAPMHATTQALAASLTPPAAANAAPAAGFSVPGIPMAVTVDAVRDLAEMLSPTIFADRRAAAPPQEPAKAPNKLESQSFELLRDERISTRVRSELSRLIPSLLSAQLSFPGTFGAPDNPPRVFVRQLALLGYRDQEFPLADFDAVRIVVDRILAEEGREIDSFRSGAEVLYTLARQEVKRRLADAAEKRAKKEPAVPARPMEAPKPEIVETVPAEDLAKHEEDARIAESRHQVAIELSERAAGIELVPPVVDFIRQILGPWMMGRYLKYGVDSPRWKEARAFATRYFEAIQPASNDEEQIRKEALRTRVLLEARLHAQRSTVEPVQAGKLISALERHLHGLEVVPPDQKGASKRTTPIDFLRDLPRVLA